MLQMVFHQFLTSGSYIFILWAGRIGVWSLERLEIIFVWLKWLILSNRTEIIPKFLIGILLRHFLYSIGNLFRFNNNNLLLFCLSQFFFLFPIFLQQLSKLWFWLASASFERALKICSTVHNIRRVGDRVVIIIKDFVSPWLCNAFCGNHLGLDYFRFLKAFLLVNLEIDWGFVILCKGIVIALAGVVFLLS